MGDCCSELHSELAALRAEIANLKPVDEQRIIKASVASAEALIMPAVGSLILSQLAPVKALIVSLENQLASIAAKAGEALAKSGQAIGTATSALGKAGEAASAAASATGTATNALGKALGAAAQAAQVAATVAALAIAIGTLFVLGARIDALENQVDSVANGLSSALGLIQGVKGLASNALQRANDAYNQALSSFGLASAASSRANLADGKADAVGATANNALSTANTASGKADAAGATANNALSTANTALNKANGLELLIRGAIAIASAALTAATTAAGSATIATNTANRAESKADEALKKAGFGGGSVTINRPFDPSSIWKKISQIDINLGEQDKLNRQGLAKLAEIGGAINQLPFAFANNSNYRNAMTTAAAAGTCQAARPGGCLGSPLENIQNKLNGVGDLLNSTGIAGLATQIGYLSSQLATSTGTILGKITAVEALMVSKFLALGKFLNVDRLLNVFSAIGTLHNAYMLSASLSDTLFGILDNAFQIFMRDAEGNSIDSKSIVGQAVDDWAKGLFGVTTWTGIKAQWKRWNRIYQAGANIINSIRSITDSIRNVVEWTAENTGRIGNAMKKFGLVGGDAFKWMPENVNAQSIWVQRLERLEDAASGIEMITSEVLSAVENLNEIQKQSEEFKKNLEGGEPKQIKDNSKVTAKESESKTSSASPIISKESESKPN